jgi:hypothetical protein
MRWMPAGGIPASRPHSAPECRPPAQLTGQRGRSSQEDRRWHTPIAHRLFAETLIVLRHEGSTVIERSGLVAIRSGCHKRIGCRRCIGWRGWIGWRSRTPDQRNAEYGQNDAGLERRRTALHLSSSRAAGCEFEAARCCKSCHLFLNRGVDTDQTAAFAALFPGRIFSLS